MPEGCDTTLFLRQGHRLWTAVQPRHRVLGRRTVYARCSDGPHEGPEPTSTSRHRADQSDRTETDRAGQVVVEPDLTVNGHPYVFVVGDLMSTPGVPGMGQGAIQEAQYTATIIKHVVNGADGPANRKPFGYHDKGSMALVSRYSAVAQVGKFEFGGYIACLAWLLLHLYYLAGHRNRIAAMFASGISFPGHTRGQMAITSQMIYARRLVDRVEQQAHETLAAAECAEEAERQAG
jgi:NADH:ubiquinone reductase (H+-translocating)